MAGSGARPFAVHWLNNKELVFSIGAEKLLAEALIDKRRMRREEIHANGRRGGREMCKGSVGEIAPQEGSAVPDGYVESPSSAIPESPIVSNASSVWAFA